MQLYYLLVVIVVSDVSNVKVMSFIVAVIFAIIWVVNNYNIFAIIWVVNNCNIFAIIWVVNNYNIFAIIWVVNNYNIFAIIWVVNNYNYRTEPHCQPNRTKLVLNWIRVFSKTEQKPNWNKKSIRHIPSVYWSAWLHEIGYNNEAFRISGSDSEILLLNFK